MVCSWLIADNGSKLAHMPGPSESPHGEVCPRGNIDASLAWETPRSLPGVLGSPTDPYKDFWIWDVLAWEAVEYVLVGSKMQDASLQ